MAAQYACARRGVVPSGTSRARRATSWCPQEPRWPLHSVAARSCQTPESGWSILHRDKHDPSRLSCTHGGTASGAKVSNRTLRSLVADQLSKGAVFALMGFFLGIAFDFYIFRETQRTTLKIEEFHLAHDMYNEFYSGKPLYKDIRTSIESCKPLYKSWGGPFTHDEINQYLGFFDDLGYFAKSGFLSADTIAHFFGAYMVEAAQYDELRRYVNLARKNSSQPEAFKDYYDLVGTIQSRTEMMQLTDTAHTMCQPQPEEGKDGSR